MGSCNHAYKQNVATYNLETGNYVKDDFALTTAPGYLPITMYRNVPDTNEHKFYIIGGTNTPIIYQNARIDGGEQFVVDPSSGLPGNLNYYHAGYTVFTITGW